MSAKTIANFGRFARERGHLSLVPFRAAPTLPPPAELPDDLERRAAHLERLASQLLQERDELLASAGRMRRK